MRKLVLAVAAAIAASLAPAGAAVAAPSGRCNVEGDYCFYYNSNHAGAKATFHEKGSVSNLRGYKFDRSGAGAGLPVKNNAASAELRFPGCSPSQCYIRVYVNSGYLGYYDQVGANSWRNLADTKNNNASVQMHLPM